MPSVTHFEIQADDIERALLFYMDVFNWKFDKWQGSEGPMEYWLITTKKEGETGINGGLGKRQGPTPTGSEPIRTFVCTVAVNSVDDYAEKIKKHGGKITSEKMPVMGIGWMYNAEDTEGNMFGIMQIDEKSM